jgi:D-glycero-alpha-D-manno-heptose 1-phosphate guanylyltransferase
MKEAIVLAGGLGSRLRSVVSDVPKPMAPVGGRPFLALLLDHLVRNGFSRVVLSVGYRAEAIVDAFGDGYRGMQLAYAREESPLGTGGAIRLGLASCTSTPIHVFNGDTYLPCDTTETDALWQKSHAPIIVARFVPNTERYGRLEVDPDTGRILRFQEKESAAGAGLINAGCYVLPREIAAEFPQSAHFSFELDYLRHAVLTRTFIAHPTDAMFIDIGTPDDYALAQTLFQTPLPQDSDRD